MAQRKLFHFVKRSYVLLTSMTSYDLLLNLIPTDSLLNSQNQVISGESHNLFPLRGAYLSPYCPDDSATQIHTKN